MSDDLPVNEWSTQHENPVPLSVFDKLNRVLQEPPERPLVFRCSHCFKAREDMAIKDPGQLKIPRTCSSAGKSCEYPASSRPLSSKDYVPGSFVLVQFRAEEWPAIVEYSTDFVGDYVVRDDEGDAMAFFVTAINVDPRYTYGGWFTPERLQPFVKGPAPDYLMQDAQEAYRQCNALADLSLRLRLLRLSSIVRALQRDGFSVDGTPPVGSTVTIRR